MLAVRHDERTRRASAPCADKRRTIIWRSLVEFQIKNLVALEPPYGIVGLKRHTFAVWAEVCLSVVAAKGELAQVFEVAFGLFGRVGLGEKFLCGERPHGHEKKQP